MRRRSPALLALLASVCLAPAARADMFGPISLASEGTLDSAGLVQQADYAHDPAISADGAYVAFDGSYGGVQGVWRRDLASGAIEAVTTCATPSEPQPATCDAQLPSISADGRYVSFTTTAALDPNEDHNKAPDVYVRDMSLPEAKQPRENAQTHQIEPGAFALASAVGGSTQGLAYEPSGSPPSVTEETRYGSIAAGRTALSADGRKVVFVTTETSNLAGGGTPALQVAVRDLDTLSTQLVSVESDPATGAPRLDAHGQPKPVSASEGSEVFGAVYSPGAPPPGLTIPEQFGYQMPPRVGASISADGTTVAWMGQDVGLQTRTLPEETLAPRYAEPLWRRIDEGQSAPIRRVTGGGDPASAACVASGERRTAEPPTVADPCEGPFRVEPPQIGAFSENASDSVPQLSADGSRVAFIADAPTFAEGSDFGSGIGNRHSDAYVADMREGLTRVQALTQLTRLAGADETDIATNASVIDLAISPDGKQVALTTQRTTFPLGVPAYVSAPASVPGMSELFDADLGDSTLTRVTQGFEGGPSEHPHEPGSAGVDPYRYRSDGALSPSFSLDGDTLAFSSTASNLVGGDGNTPPLGSSGKFDGADAFVVQRLTFPARSPAEEISPPPPDPPLAPARRLALTARERADGSVLLYVQAPEAGRLGASASAAVTVRGAGGARRAHVRAAMRTVARASASADAEGHAQIRLPLASRYRVLAAARGGLSATVTVTFASPGHPSLRQSIAVTFSHRVEGARARRRVRRAARGGR